jgi:hypothetical protein
MSVKMLFCCVWGHGVTVKCIIIAAEDMLLHAAFVFACYERCNGLSRYNFSVVLSVFAIMTVHKHVIYEHC